MEPSALTAQICWFAQGDDGWSTIAPTTSTSTASLVESGSKPVDAVRLSNKYGPLKTGISGKASGGSKSHPHGRPVRALDVDNSPLAGLQLCLTAVCACVYAGQAGLAKADGVVTGRLRQHLPRAPAQLPGGARTHVSDFPGRAALLVRLGLCCQRDRLLQGAAQEEVVARQGEQGASAG